MLPFSISEASSGTAVAIFGGVLFRLLDDGRKTAHHHGRSGALSNVITVLYGGKARGPLRERPRPTAVERSLYAHDICKSIRLGFGVDLVGAQVVLIVGYPAS